jgi:[ribosomal protein S5]-alanine N-acetyltransferase
MLINGQNTYMELFERQHLDDPVYYAWLCDLDVVRYIGRDELLTGVSFSEVEGYVKHLWSNENCWFFAVHHAQSGSFIGTAKVNFFSERGRRIGVADIGIMLGDRAFWGRGLATDVLRAVSKFAFDELGARKLSAGAMSPNVAVLKAFFRVGYVEEGRLRQHLPLQDDYCEHVLLGCFKNELLLSPSSPIS